MSQPQARLPRPLRASCSIAVSLCSCFGVWRTSSAVSSRAFTLSEAKGSEGSAVFWSVAARRRFPASLLSWSLPRAQAEGSGGTRRLCCFVREARSLCPGCLCGAHVASRSRGISPGLIVCHPERSEGSAFRFAARRQSLYGNWGSELQLRHKASKIGAALAAEEMFWGFVQNSSACASNERRAIVRRISMDIRALFGLSALMSLVASGVAANLFVWPRLRIMSQRD